MKLLRNAAAYTARQRTWQRCPAQTEEFIKTRVRRLEWKWRRGLIFDPCAHPLAQPGLMNICAIMVITRKRVDLAVRLNRRVRRDGRFLHHEGVIKDIDATVTDKTLAALEKRDLQVAAKAVAQKLGKEFTPAPQSGRISGNYVERIDRPSGRYAVIERTNFFSLVPWREVMDRNLGKQVSGIIRGRQISWTLTRGRRIE